MIDAHTHLNDEKLFPSWKKHVDEFVYVWGHGLVTVTIDEASAKRNILVCEEVESLDLPCLVKTTLWYHPYEVVRWAITKKNMADAFWSMLSLYEEHSEMVVALGECGVDLHYDGASKTLGLQQELFAVHCQRALETGMPVVVHSRDAFEETLVVAQDFPDLRFYFHCWGYDAAQLEILFSVLSDVYVGFCGNVSYKKADPLRASLAAMPLDRLLLETDAPYLSPQVKRGETNQPSYVSFLYDYVADLLWKDPSSLKQAVSKNFMDLYNL